MSHSKEIDQLDSGYDKILNAFQAGQIDEQQAIEYTATLTVTDAAGTLWGITPQRELWSQNAATGQRTQPANSDDFISATTNPTSGLSPLESDPSVNSYDSYHSPAHTSLPQSYPSHTNPDVYTGASTSHSNIDSATTESPFSVDAVKETLMDVLLSWKDFSGTATRRQFLTWTVATFVVSLVLSVLFSMVNLGIITTILQLVVLVALVVPTVSLTFRRTKDVGLPSKLALLMFIPLLNMVVFGWCVAPGRSQLQSSRSLS